MAQTGPIGLGSAITSRTDPVPTSLLNRERQWDYQYFVTKRFEAPTWLILLRICAAPCVFSRLANTAGLLKAPSHGTTGG